MRTGNHRKRAGVPGGAPIEIAFWLGSLRHVPAVDDIQQRWQVARATAYRWRAFALAGGRSQQSERTPRARRA